MSSKVKYIGIESRIQYEVLEAAVFDYLQNGSIDKERCLLHIKQFTKGDNRAVKILKHISVLLKNNKYVLEIISRNLDTSTFYQIGISDRRALICCLFCQSFPIGYDILIVLAQALKVQEIVSKEVIVQKIGAIYGGNRAMHIAITEVMPLLIEFGLIVRVKVGLYTSAKKLTIANNLISEIVLYTDIKLSGSKSVLIDDLNFKPWYSFFDISSLETEKLSKFISKKESAVGKGYLSISN
ncbi:MAG: hypothetical protein KA450_03905 [Bacteroidia bacterium]|nr:hypothetical protein [Bacteroidia bacterium]